ncbi:hypothetical protein [Chryseobacterium caseinilyticum]|uniref:Uncharacterized protein n=1 Tax=Chryseobacterium caseinilyticum TaxID=2771428 RepID=A0ABR8ZDH0_9FLAO|nr:hypothetical protein [Chryseobacterium caseinilyticum]MBD8083302.1 hypothetical protein [Chryseobacterium caseinilyticum]
MKKIFLYFFGLANALCYSQTQDLASLASGDYLGMNALFDVDDNLYGYVSLYSYGKSGDRTKKFEYVILDKNLNPIANKEFEGDITAGGYSGYIDFRKKVILRPNSLDYTKIKMSEIFTPRSMEIDLGSNTIQRKTYYNYESGAFKEIDQPKNWKEARKENREEKKEKGYNYESTVVEIKEGGFIAIELKDFGKYTTDNALIKFDENKKEIWRYKYNTSGDKKNNERLRLLDKDDQHIYFLAEKKIQDKKTFSLLVLDIKTGNEVASKPVTGLSDDTLENITSLSSTTRNLDNDKTFDDKIVVIGRNFENKMGTGFARMIVDKKTFEVDTKRMIYYTDMAAFLPKIDEFGYVEKGYHLQPRDVFFLKDGSMGILLEKYKIDFNLGVGKTTDLVYLFTDKNFKIKGVKVFSKEKSLYDNDYLFSQYLNDGNDVVFFYRDFQKNKETKEKNWQLFINTLIGGSFKQEVIPISEKDNFVVTPFVAKEGFILLREYNEKDKYNKVRLERLNY